MRKRWSPIVQIQFFGGMQMNAVGIDVSKGKSMIAVMRPFGEIVASPFEVTHDNSEISKLAGKLKSLNGETKVIMECTGVYHLPIAHALREAGLMVCTVHPMLIHDFGNNSIRKVKTDKADAIKIANYGMTNWLDLLEYVPEEDIRHMLKVYSRQYNKYTKLKTMLKNNLISLLDQTFPGVNELFTSPPRESDGHQKWLDFAAVFWHCECVCGLSQKVFAERYRKWCKRAGYNFSQSKADSIYVVSCGHPCVMPKNETTKLLVTQAIAQINAIAESLSVISREMRRLATLLPEYSVVMAFNGVGETLGSQLMAEIGDVYRFSRKESLVCFAGLEAPPHQSGKFESENRSISKKGSPHLRKTLFQVMDCLLKHSPATDPVYQFLDRKRTEGKHYYSYMTAGSAKFLRIYYARVKEFLNKYYS
jgi:transposase